MGVFSRRPWIAGLAVFAALLAAPFVLSTYGVIILTYMAGRDTDRIHTTRDVAEWTDLPLPMVSKILKTLSREGLLVSHRGAKGGYGLARAPERISVGSIISALEGPIGITECASAPGSCEHESGCPVRVNWQKISGAVREALDRIPLSEMVGAPPSDLVVLDGSRSSLSGTRAS